MGKLRLRQGIVSKNAYFNPELNRYSDIEDK